MSRIQKRLTPVSTARMQSALQLQAYSLDDLVAITGLAKPVVTRYVNELCEAKMVHVGEWARDKRGYPTIRKYRFGEAPDAVCPRKTLTPAERMKALRADRKVGLR